MSSRIAAATISPIAAAMTWATTVTSSRITGRPARRGPGVLGVHVRMMAERLVGVVLGAKRSTPVRGGAAR